MSQTITRLILLLIVSSSASCSNNSHNCSEKGYGQVVNYFQKEIRLMEQHATNGSPLNKSNILALSLFERFTGKTVNVNIGDILTYDSWQDFNDDKNQILEWLDEQKCTISDSLFYEEINILKDNFKWIEEVAPND